MNILKLGSKGEDVKTLQTKLGITPDGDFGKKTEEAVKKFQTEKGLTADGIVGNKTWELLGIKDFIIKMPLSKHISSLPNRDIRYIAIHFTAGSSSAPGKAKNNKSIFELRLASADFGVDDQDIVQFNPDLKNYYCWSVGDKLSTLEGGGSLAKVASNKNTISIEICSSLKKGWTFAYANHEGWYFTEEALNNAIKLTKYLMKTYNVPIERVVRHYDISGKLCPGIIGWNDGNIYSNDGKRTKEKNNSSEWLKFKERLK